MKILYDMIHSATDKKFGKSLTLENHEEWAHLWIDTAKEIRHSFEEQGLHETAKTLDLIIEFNEDLLR